MCGNGLCDVPKEPGEGLLGIAQGLFVRQRVCGVDKAVYPLEHRRLREYYLYPRRVASRVSKERAPHTSRSLRCHQRNNVRRRRKIERHVPREKRTKLVNVAVGQRTDAFEYITNTWTKGQPRVSLRKMETDR
jgi:hypothetical protein